MANSKATVVITGANGFLGSKLVKHFAAKKWQVRALVRNLKNYKNTKYVTYISYSLGYTVPKAVFNGADYFIHAAYIKYNRQHPDAFKQNVNAAKKLLQASREHKLKKNIFISSMSAHPGAVSVYGQQKLAIEKLFSSKQDVSLRAGLIVGNGGIVQDMASFMKSMHIVPVVSGGNQPLQIIGVDDLVKAIEIVVTGRVSGVLTIANPHVYTYQEFYRALADKQKIKVLLVHVPFEVMLWLVRSLTRLHIPLAVSEDNLWGLRKLQAVDTKIDLSKLSLNTHNLNQVLSSLQSLD